MDSELEGVSDAVENDDYEVADAVEVEDDAIDALPDDEAADVDQEEAAEGEVPGADADDEADAAPEIVLLDGGDEVALTDLKEAYIQKANFERQSAEIEAAREQAEAVRQSFTERQQYTENLLTGVTQFLEGLVPPEPPVTLAQSNPNEYQYQKAMRENALRELGQLVEMKQGMAQTVQGYSEADMQRHQSEENAKLLKAMPHLASPERRKAFDADVIATAAEFGFSEQEVAGATDHRILQLVHYAKLGKKAETNRANAKRRTQAPKQGKSRPAQTSAAVTNQRKAKARLHQTGSLEDALALDF